MVVKISPQLQDRNTKRKKQNECVLLRRRLGAHRGLNAVSRVFGNGLSECFIGFAPKYTHPLVWSLHARTGLRRWRRIRLGQGGSAESKYY